MALMLALGAALCLVGAIRPATPDTPRVLDGILAGVGGALALIVWWTPARAWLLHLCSAVYLVAATALMAAAATGEGVASGGVSFVWLGMYAAVVHPRPVARAYAIVCAVALWVGFAFSPVVRSGWASWLVIAVTLVIAVEVLATLLTRLTGMATTDQLTGAHNRAALQSAVESELITAIRTGDPVSLVLIDLDDFKCVNDSAGHGAGDQLLVDLAAEWRAGIRRGDRLFRYGGDEFVLLLPRTGVTAAEELVRRLHDSSRAAWSFGITQLGTGDHLATAIDRADQRMYAHKLRGAGMVPAGVREPLAGKG